jgi:peptidoglycan/LPS O-acetylase OafA/YrhL
VFGEGGLDADRGTGFLVRVESVRGVAALMVTLLHAFLVLNGHWELWLGAFPPVNSIQAFMTKSLLTLFNGQAGVTIFFVISGFVLGLSLDRGKSGFLQNGTKFILRRAFRIYPAHVVALGCTMAYLIFHEVRPQPNGSGWFNHVYSEPVSLLVIAANMLLLSNTINPPTWTLTVEMVAALLLPVLHGMNRRVSRFQSLGVLALLMLVTYKFHHVVSLVWLFAFYLGLMLPSWGQDIAARTSRSRLGTSAAFACALCVFLFVRTALHGHGTVTPPIVEYAEAFAAAAILGLTIYGRELACYRFLDLPLVRFYGRISYSLYLYHVLVLYVVSSLLFAYAPGAALMRYPVIFSAMIGVATVVGATVLATVSYVWIEKPGIDLGKELAARIWPKRVVTVA